LGHWREAVHGQRQQGDSRHLPAILCHHHHHGQGQ
jgi:hypothetical protein